MTEVPGVKVQLFESIKNRGLIRGSLVQSLAGHDRRQAFLVIRVEGGFVWLADGVNRSLGQPKKKRVSHVRPLGQLPDPAALDRIEALGDAGQRDAALRKLLHELIATNLTEEET